MFRILQGCQQAACKGMHEMLLRPACAATSCGQPPPRLLSGLLLVTLAAAAGAWEPTPCAEACGLSVLLNELIICRQHGLPFMCAKEVRERAGEVHLMREPHINRGVRMGIASRMRVSKEVQAKEGRAQAFHSCAGSGGGGRRRAAEA